MSNPRTEIKEERLDHGAVFEALAKLAEAGNPLKYRTQLAGYVAKHIADVERAHGDMLIAVLGRLCDVYEASSDRRYRATWFTRMVRLGMPGPRDADRSAAGARHEIEALLAMVEASFARQTRDALLLRAPLLQFIAASGDGGVELAMRLLKTSLPEVHERVLALAADQQRAGDPEE